MGIQNIIFDWDGTLAKTLHLWLSGYQSALDRRDLRFEPTQIVAEFFHDHHKVPERHPYLDFPAVAVETRNHVFQASNSLNLYDGALETLKMLQTQMKSLSLVSSSSRALLENGLCAHNLREFFISTVSGDDGYGHKPDTLPFSETLDRMGVMAEDTLIIGDSHVDILAGKAIGCRTCLFIPPENGLFHNFERLKALNADHDVTHLSALLNHV